MSKINKKENETLVVYDSINRPGWYLIFDGPADMEQENIELLFFAYAISASTKESAQWVLAHPDCWTKTWFGWEVFDDELPKPKKPKKEYKEKEVKPLTFTIGEILKGKEKGA